MTQYTYTGRDTLFQNRAIANKVLNWHSTDSEQAFNTNKNVIDPIYVNGDRNITYKFNSMGYRAPELDTFTDNQFMLAMGCSYTSGTGLHVDDIWCSVLADRLSMPVMNLGMDGMGIEIVLVNTLNYINSDLPKPKFVVVQHSETSRKLQALTIDDSIIVEISSEHESAKDHYDQLNQQGNLTNLFWCGYYTDLITKLWNDIGVPVIHWTHSGDGENSLTGIKIHSMLEDFEHTPLCDGAVFPYCARDNCHDGREKNKLIAELLYPMVVSMMDNNVLCETVTGNSVNTDQEKIKSQILKSRSRSSIIYN